MVALQPLTLGSGDVPREGLRSMTGELGIKSELKGGGYSQTRPS